MSHRMRDWGRTRRGILALGLACAMAWGTVAPALAGGDGFDTQGVLESGHGEDIDQIDDTESVDAIVEERDVDVLLDDVVGLEEVNERCGDKSVNAEGPDDAPELEIESALEPGLEESPALYVQSGDEAYASGTWGTCPWEIGTDGTLTIHPGEGGTDRPWADYAEKVKSVRMVREGAGRVVLPSSCRSLFSQLGRAADMDLSGADASRVTDMRNMFYGCSLLTSLDLSAWDTSSVTDMGLMFDGCNALTALDVSGWDTSRVTNMRRLFTGCCSITSLDVSGWDTSNVTHMGDMFSACRSLWSLDVSRWDTSSVTNMKGMFSDCSSLASLDVSRWDTSSVTNMKGMFSGCSSLASLDVSGWDTSSVVSMNCMFFGCSALASLDFSGWDTSSVTSMYHMFSGCSALASLDVSGWDTSSVVSMNCMFFGCSALASLDFSGWDTSSVTDMEGMFVRCSSLASLDFSGWDTSSVTNMEGMFAHCSALTSLKLTGLDTSSVTNMVEVFYGCSSLTCLDLSGWNTSNATRMTKMFADCSSLSALKAFSWDTAKVTDMAYMLSGCSKLASLDLSGWNTWSVSSTVGTNGMFSGCTSLATFKVGAHYAIKAAAAFPVATSVSGRWWSKADHRWYSKDEIVSGRSEVADTYTAKAEPGYETHVSGLSLEAPKTQTYTGRALTPSVTLRDGGYTLRTSTDYTLAYQDNVAAGTATVTITGRGDYKGSRSATFSIARASVAVPKATNRTYNGKAQVGVAAGTGYKLSGTAKATAAGTYTAKATPDANHRWPDGTTGAKTLTWKVGKAASSVRLAAQTRTYTGKALAYTGKVSRSGSAGKVTYRYFSDAKCTKAVKAANVKAAKTYYVRATLAADANHKAATSAAAKLVVAKARNPIAATAVTRTAKLATVKKRAVTVARPMSVSKARGKVTYAKVAKGSAKCLTVNKSTGKVAVKRGTKKGTYKIKIKVTAAGNANYKAGSKTVVCKVTVK